MVNLQSERLSSTSGGFMEWKPKMLKRKLIFSLSCFNFQMLKGNRMIALIKVLMVIANSI